MKPVESYLHLIEKGIFDINSQDEVKEII